MVHVTFGSAVPRSAGHLGRLARPVVFTLTAFAAASGAGATLGAAGSVLSSEERIVAAAIASTAAVLVGALELFGRTVKVPQHDRETPRTWMQYGNVASAALNGAALGTGWSTRIGYWLWFAVPLGALLSGSVAVGIAVYGTYGLARGLGPWLVRGGERMRRRASAAGPTRVGAWLIGRHHAMKVIASAQLASLGLADLISHVI